MSLDERLAADLREAMKAGDTARRDALRLFRAALLDASKETGRPLDEAGAVAVLQKQAKQRRDSIDAYRAGGRDDLADREAGELAYLETYLPAALDPAELEALVAAAIAEVGAGDAKQMGAVMRVLMPRVGGRATGAEVNAVVRRLLG